MKDIDLNSDTLKGEISIWDPSLVRERVAVYRSSRAEQTLALLLACLVFLFMGIPAALIAFSDSNEGSQVEIWALEKTSEAVLKETHEDRQALLPVNSTGSGKPNESVEMLKATKERVADKELSEDQFDQLYNTLVTAELNVSAAEVPKLPEHFEETPKALEPGWYVQVSSEKDPIKAAEILKQLAEKNVLGTLESTTIKNEVFVRVLIGPYAEKDAAFKTKSLISKFSFVPPDAFLRKVN